MRRKSERAAKKAKSTPEKKVEKVKRTRTRRSRKQSTSSENESVDEEKIVPATVVADVETKVAEIPAKDASLEDTPDQVWQVKTAQAPGESGEIQKLKICLKRPPSTPERLDRSPRSKRKHSRATSSSDTPSIEGVEDKKKKHRSKRLARESKDSEKNHESQSDEPDKDVTNESTDADSNVNEISQSELPANEPVAGEIPESTTVEDTKTEEAVQSTVVVEEERSENEQSVTEPQPQVEEKDESVADTTVASPNKNLEEKQPDVQIISENDAAEVENEVTETVTEPETQIKEDSKDVPETAKEQEHVPKEDSADKQVSIEIPVSESVAESSQGKEVQATNRNDVVEEDATRERKMSTDSNKEKDADQSHERFRGQELERSESVQSTPEETKVNGQATPIVINRRRRWGSRLSKGTAQKSITISTDILKDIIPDVKPTEFNEVIDEKKHHKRVDMSERLERPVLPKITIDNTDAVEHKRDSENEKIKETLPVANRKISIVRDDDFVMARPPSPPRNKQSCVLYITNLVRPFTLPQLKNLLQRTGRIAEEGFWIDKIKSKCFVVYENEDQAVETRHALHGVTWPVSNPKTLQVDFSTQEAFEKAKANEDSDNAKVSTIPGTVEDWLREQDLKRERGELDKPWDRKAVREWDMGKGDKPTDEKLNRDDKSVDKRRHRTPERSPEPAKKFKKKEEEAPAKLLDDLFRKTKATPCIYWLPLSAETIAIKEEQRRQHMAEHERRLNELRRHRRH